AHPSNQKEPVLLVQAGSAPVANSVRVIQEFRLPRDGFGLRGRPRFSLNVEANALPLDDAEASTWQTFVQNGISKVKPARDNWEQWSASPRNQVAQIAPTYRRVIFWP